MEDKLQIAISGKSIYKAVACYLKDSEVLKKSIEDAVKKALDSEAMTAAIEHRIQKAIDDHVWYKLYDEGAEVMTRTAIREGVDKMVMAELERTNLTDVLVKSIIRLADKSR